MNEDIYFKKEIAFEDGGRVTRFRVSQDLFSSHQVDVGTRFLLRTIAETNDGAHRRILDLGCGYGAIGLTLKKRDNERIVHMVDRDALAVEYSRQNAGLNQLSGVEIYGSLGYDDVPITDFDLVIANIPGKAGESVIAHFLQDAVYFLRKGGAVSVVVTAPLESTVAAIIDDTPGTHLLLHRTRSGHSVFHYEPAGTHDKTTQQRQNAIERGVYHRNNLTISFRGLTYDMETAYGLPEFDSLDYRSQLLMAGMNSIKETTIRRVLAFNPGQGHVPVALWKLLRPNNVILADRDLLSLRYSRKNLVLNGCPAEYIDLSHQVGIGLENGQQVDLIIGTLREKEGTRAIASLIEQITEQLSPGRTALLSASSTAVTRLVNLLRSQDLLRIKQRERRKGNSLLVVERN